MVVALMFYRRHLPHWQQPDKALFLTWRLSGSLPQRILRASLKEKNLGKRFLSIDQELDRARYGPTWLKDIRIAKTVVNSFSHGVEQLRLYTLAAYVVMSNHVHLLVWPKTELSVITKSLKGFTAREANRTLDRTGQTFWQDESFDHVVRNEDEFYRIKR